MQFVTLQVTEQLLKPSEQFPQRFATQTNVDSAHVRSNHQQHINVIVYLVLLVQTVIHKLQLVIHALQIHAMPVVFALMLARQDLDAHVQMDSVVHSAEVS